MDSHNDLLGELAADAALERSDFLVQSTEQLRKFLDHHKERIADARRPDAHRRGARLPLDRAGPDVPQPQPVPRRGDRRVGQRDRGHRERRGARRALQPGRHLRRVRRGGPRGGGHAAEPTAEADLLDDRRHLARGDRPARRGPVRRRRRLVGRRPGRAPRRRRRRGRRPSAVRPRARVPGAQPAQRSAPARGVRGGVGRAQRASSAT